ncbi:hypothetical protein [Nostoc sphaeroides]|uniref:hypothetical protein n=1 Tax=Nostoc sphaeroides TaxID=446679 RepID=UPI002B3FFCD3|nr:hypothetical protein [Nostoc sphaeroides]
MSTQTISNPLASCTNLSAESSEQNSTFDYSNLNTSIHETFTAIDRFEWQAVDEILQMREQQLYLQAGYKNFSEYCQRELCVWGGYRRINQLLGAKKVIDTVGELGGHIKNERQARPLLRLVKEPEKLKQAVAISLWKKTLTQAFQTLLLLPKKWFLNFHAKSNSIRNQWFLKFKNQWFLPLLSQFHNSLILVMEIRE